MQEFFEAVQVSVYAEPAFVDIIVSVYTRLVADLSDNIGKKLAEFFQFVAYLVLY